MEKYKILKSVDFLESLSDLELQKVYDCSQEVHLKEDEFLFKENDLGDSFYIITKGSIGLIKSVEGDETGGAELQTLSKSEYFGEMSLIDESPRSASAKATEDSILLQITKDDFLFLCMEYPNILMQLTRVMSTRLRETNDRFVEMWSSLLKRNKLAAIGTAASKIVHDVKTPITVIVLTAQLVGKMFPETKEFTERIVHQTKVMDEMVREILEFARGEQSKLKLKLISTAMLYSEVISDMLPIMQDRRLHFIHEDKTELMINADFPKLKRVLINIIKNAMEVLSEDGKIEFSCWNDEKKYYVRIADSGPGIPEEIIETLFEPFVTQGKKSGTGLGLAICKKIILDHGGDITVRNSDDGGAVFEFWVPTNISN